MPVYDDPSLASGPRLRPIDKNEFNKRIQYEIEYRFVKEVERLEREGRSKGRGWIEEVLQLNSGGIADIRRGRTGIMAYHIQLLKRLLNGDDRWVIHGVGQPDAEYSRPYVLARGGKLDIFRPYIHPYLQPAGWKCGPRAETHEAYYPDDPGNALWQPYARAGKVAKANQKKGDEQAE